MGGQQFGAGTVLIDTRGLDRVLGFDRIKGLVTVEGGDERDVTFHTHLVREDGRWKVDLAASRAELRKGLFVAGMREIGEAVGEGVKEIGDAIREGALEMEEALREALEGIDDGSRL